MEDIRRQRKTSIVFSIGKIRNREQGEMKSMDKNLMTEEEIKQLQNKIKKRIRQQKQEERKRKIG